MMLLSAGARTNLACSAERAGRINLGLCGIAYYMLFFPFINIWKCAGPIQVVANGIDRWSNIPPGTANSAWDGFLNHEGELARPLPSDVTRMLRIFYAKSSDGLPAGYNRVGEQWVLKWDGRATDVSISGASSSTRGLSRIVWIWASNTSNMWVTFAGIDHNDPPRNIRLCEGRFEDRLDTGEIFNPDWLEKIRGGSGIVRFMDWQSTNFNTSTLRFTDFPDQEYCTYGGATAKPFIRGGMPLPIMSGLANRVQSHPWVCIPNVLGTRKLSSIATISNANPAVVTSSGHKWENGDTVIPYGTNWPQIERSRWTVIDSDQKAGSFALAGADSTSFGPYRSGWASVTAPFDLNSIAREVVPFVVHYRDNIEPGLITYYELGNELWNASFNAFHWLAAQARSKIERDDSYWMSGYLAAHFMNVIRDAYGADGRNKWRGVLATQTVNPEVTRRMIAGINQYIKEHDLSLKLTDLFNDLAVTGYFGGNFSKAQKITVLDWMNTSEQRWNNDLEPSKYNYFNRVVNEDIADGRYTHLRFSIDKLVGFWRDQKAIADANGLGFIQYEGGNGNVPEFLGELTEAERQRLLDFYKHSCHTTEDASNYTSMFNAFVAVGGKYPAKFVEGGPVTRFGNWGALRYLGDSNPVWDAVVAFNKRGP
jgi:hypothetical protein